MRRALGRDLRAVGHREQLLARARQPREPFADRARDRTANAAVDFIEDDRVGAALLGERDLEREDEARRSEEHTSELQSLMRISYAVFCLKKKKHWHIIHSQ